MNTFVEKFLQFLKTNQEDLLASLEAVEKEMVDDVKKYVGENSEELKELVISKWEVFKQKDARGDYLLIRGVASNGNQDRTRDIVVPEGITIVPPSKKTLPIFLNHNYDKCLGSITRWWIENGNFMVEGKVYKRDEAVYDALLKGDYQAFSIGFRVLEWHEDEENKVYVFTKIDLFEVSVVGVGAHQEALIDGVAEIRAKKLTATVTKSEGEGESGKTPVIPAVDETPVVDPKAKSDPAPDAKDETIKDLQSQVDQLQNEVSQLQSSSAEKDTQIASLSSEKAEVEAALEQATELIEIQTEQLEKKYEFETK